MDGRDVPLCETCGQIDVDYEPDPPVIRASPDYDQCGIPGHGGVWLELRCEYEESRMYVMASCDHMGASFTLTKDEAMDLARQLTTAVEAVDVGPRGMRERREAMAKEADDGQ